MVIAAVTARDAGCAIQEDDVGQGHVLGIFFELINEDAAVQRNAVVTLEGGAEAV